MPLLNYTTSVAAVRTLGEITSLLVQHGAAQVLGEYADGRTVSLAFAMPTPHGLRQYRLPVDPAAVERVLRRQRVSPRYRSAEHAERVAWRILKDWVEAQLAIVATQMVSLDQVMLPYMLVEGATVYDRFLSEQPALGPGE